MRKAALLASALTLGASAFLPGSSGPTAQQVAQEAKAHAERQAQKNGGPAAPGQQRGAFGLGGGRGWGAPSVGGYRKRPRSTHKQNARVEARRLRRRARG